MPVPRKRNRVPGASSRVRLTMPAQSAAPLRRLQAPMKTTSLRSSRSAAGRAGGQGGGVLAGQAERIDHAPVADAELLAQVAPLVLIGHVDQVGGEHAALAGGGRPALGPAGQELTSPRSREAFGHALRRRSRY